METRLGTAVCVRAEISVLLLGAQDSLDPYLGLGLQGIVFKDVGQGKEAVYPVGAPLPCVSVTSQPGVPCTYDVGIDLVQMTGQAGDLGLHLEFEPSLGLDSPERELKITALKKRRPVIDIVLG